MYSGTRSFMYARHSLVSPCSLRRHHVGHQPLLAITAWAHHDRRFADSLVLIQDRFYLSDLDTEAAYLHLLVQTTEKLDEPSGRKRARSPES